MMLKKGETPEMIADKLYGDPNLHWIVMYVNGITDRYHQWPYLHHSFLHLLMTSIAILMVHTITR